MFIVTVFYPEGARRFGYLNEKTSFEALLRMSRENKGITVRWEVFKDERI